MIRATFELDPPGSGEAVAIEESVGMQDAPEVARARVVSEHGGRAVLEFPEDNWGDNVPLLLSALVAGEAMEDRSLTRCRLVDLELPPGLLPGPAFDPPPDARVGVIFKPSIGLTPGEVGALARAAIRGGAWLVKDDELHGDPPWCPLEERVRAVADVLEPGVVYCPNITGPGPTLVERAHRVVELGATGIMVNAFTQGPDAVLSLRRAGLGVPVLAHRVGSGPSARSRHFGATGAVLARLTRLCGGDFVLAGAFGGKLFDTDDEVEAQLDAIRGPLPGVRAATALLGGGVGPHNARDQVERAGGGGVVALMGSNAYGRPGGLEAAVREAVEAVAAVRA